MTLLICNTNPLIIGKPKLFFLQDFTIALLLCPIEKISKGPSMKLLHFLAKLLRSHTITTWTRRGRYVVTDHWSVESLCL